MTNPTTKRTYPHFNLWVLLLLALVNFILAARIGLFHDEAYYWFYSLHPQWGYFDHPPMVSWLIYLGRSIFPGKFGIRFFMVCCNIGTLYLLLQLIKPKEKVTYWLLIFSVGILPLFFFAFPDTPLLFFTVFFLYAYRRFLKKDSWGNTILLGIAMLGLVYSKYQGAIVILLTLFSNNKLWRSKRFWTCSVVAFCLFLPYLYWEYQHHWISFTYQLSGRFHRAWSPAFVLLYIAGVLALVGPLSGFITLPAAWKNPNKSPFNRTLKFILFGFIFFFLLSTFKGKAEANWNIPILIPLILLAYSQIENNRRLKKWIRILGAITFGLGIFVRLWMLPSIGSSIPFFHKNEIHGWQTWAKKIHQMAGDAPVVFYNSYQYPSKYMFYTGETAFSYNTMRYSGNQFGLSPIEDSLQGKKVFLIPNYPAFYADTLFVYNGKVWYYCRVNSFHSYNKIKVKLNPSDLSSSLTSGSIQTLHITLQNLYKHPVTFAGVMSEKARITYQFRKNNKIYGEAINLLPLNGLKIKDTLSFTGQIKLPQKPGEYTLWIYIRPGILPPGHRGFSKNITVKNP